MSPCSLEESGPLRFTSTESLLELTWPYLDISKSEIKIFISVTHRLVNKLQKMLETRGHKYPIFVSTSSAAISGSFSWSSRKSSDFLVLNAKIRAKRYFKSWFGLMLVRLMFLKGIFDKELSKFCCIWPIMPGRGEPKVWELWENVVKGAEFVEIRLKTPDPNEWNNIQREN